MGQQTLFVMYFAHPLARAHTHTYDLFVMSYGCLYGVTLSVKGHPGLNWGVKVHSTQTVDCMAS